MKYQVISELTSSQQCLLYILRMSTHCHMELDQIGFGGSGLSMYMQFSSDLSMRLEVGLTNYYVIYSEVIFSQQCLLGY